MSIDIDAITLAKGSHATPDEGMCLMEAVAYVAGEPHSDHPQCVCPVLAAFGRAWNDGLPDEDRDRLLKPFIPLLVGTRSTPAVEQQRGYMAADWLVRVVTPVWLRAAGLDDAAAELDALPPLASVEACRDAMPTIAKVREAAIAARAAAWDAAAAAAWAAAQAAAWAAATDAATAAATDAARNAARAAAAAAARNAAMDAAADAAAAATPAAWAAATAAAAAGVALRPHVEQLQASAVDLYERMIEVTA